MLLFDAMTVDVCSCFAIQEDAWTVTKHYFVKVQCTLVAAGTHLVDLEDAFAVLWCTFWSKLSRIKLLY